MRPSPMLFRGTLLLIALYLCLPYLTSAQTEQIPPRVTEPIDENKLTLLQGNIHPLARAEFDRGASSRSLPLERMLLVLKRSPEQEAALDELLDQQQDKSSSNYHRWLAPEQIGQQFGPSDIDIQAATDWLTSQGFRVNKVSKGRTVIEFSGDAGLVLNAFHTEIHKFVVNGVEHWANANDQQIPAALARVVAGVATLHDFYKRPQIVMPGGPTGSLGLGPLLTFPHERH